MNSADNKHDVEQETATPESDSPATSAGNRNSTSGSSQSVEPQSPALDEYDPYAEDSSHDSQPETALAVSPPKPAPAVASPPPPPPPPPVDLDDDEGGGEEGMLRMSFLEHLEELRSRLLHSLIGVGVAFALSLIFVGELWQIIQEPAAAALTKLGVHPPTLVILSPTEAFSLVWVKLPILTAIFIASPWLLYQVWAFISPGLYKRERRWAAPFIICGAGLFVLGGLFGYFVAFRFGLTFLLGIGVANNLQPMVSATEYFNTFVNVTLALGLVFELPVLIFFLTLLRVVTPQFLVRNSRYAILLIVIVAAIVTPTPDVINLMMISVPMAVLYFAGVFASYLLWLSRQNQRFPWALLLLIVAIIALLVAGGVWLAIAKYNYQLVPMWPFLVRN